MMEQLVSHSPQSSANRGSTTVHHPRLGSILRGQGDSEIVLEPGLLPEPLQAANDHLRAHCPDAARVCLGAEARQALLEILALDPSRTDLMYVTAKLHMELGQFEEAMSWLTRITTLEAHPLVFANLARCAEQRSGCRSAGLDYWRRAHELTPHAWTHREAYALCLRDTGFVEESVRLYQQGLAHAQSHYTALFQLIWGLHYCPDTRRAELFTRAQAWAATEPNRAAGMEDFSNDPSPDRRLSVGILSGDFKTNSPLSYFDGALACLDRDAFNMIALSNIERENPGTADYRKMFDRFEDVRPLVGHRVAALVRDLGIDILIAFGGQCQNNRLDVMALKPAPIQVDWGGLCSLGLPQIDYRITDAVLDPPQTQCYHQERLSYLPGGSICFDPPSISPPVTSLPARANGHLTFGAFNNHLKMNAEVVTLWSRILLKIPDARMVIKTPCAADPGVRQTLLERFTRHGVAAERISVNGPCTHYQHLQQLGEVDLLLDSYPFNSFRTTLEGLWMGVPTVTLSGETFVSRMGLAVYAQLDLMTLVANNAETFVEKACAFAVQWDQLSALRERLRHYLMTSSVCDPTHFARGFSGLLRGMWRQWCADQESEA